MVELIRIDTAACQAWQGDRPLKLRPTEFRLLAYLAANAGHAITTAQILTDVWGSTWRNGGPTLTMYVSWLRKSLGDDPASPTYIVTLPRHGYRLNASTVAARPEAERLRVDLAAAADIIRAALVAGHRHGPAVGIRVLRDRAGDVGGLLDGLDLDQAEAQHA